MSTVSPQNILIIGANSAVARAVARIYCEAGHRLYLVGRDQQKLAATCDDLSARGAQVVGSFAADLTEDHVHPDLIAKAFQAFGHVDIVLIAHGDLGDQLAAENDFTQTRCLFNANFLSVVGLLIALINILSAQQSSSCCIAVISSIAGDRGRRTNYIYGAAKGALSIYLSGLRQRLVRSHIGILDLKLGIVDSPMTAQLPRSRLEVQPAQAASGIVRAISKGRGVVYFPRRWRLIMAIVRAIPERIFQHLKF